MDNDKMAEMQMIEYQIRQMQQILENIDAQLNEVSSTKDALGEFGALKGTEEAFFPLANGIFVKGRLSDSKLVRMNIGSNVVVEKTIADAIIMMEKQYSEMNEYREQLVKQLNDLMQKVQ